DALGQPIAAVWHEDVWQAAGRTSAGLSAALVLACVGVALLGWFARSRVIKRWLAAAAVVLLGLSLAATGHASSAPPQLLARPSVWLHGLAALFWVGAFIPLWLTLTPQNTTNLSNLRVFSRFIPLALLLLIASGVTLAILQLG